MDAPLVIDKLKYEDQIKEFLFKFKITLTKNFSYEEDIYHHICGGLYSLKDKQNQCIKAFLTRKEANNYISKFKLTGVSLNKYDLQYKNKIYILGCDSSYYSINLILLKIHNNGTASLESTSKRNFDFFLKTWQYVPNSIFKIIQKEHKQVI